MIRLAWTAGLALVLSAATLALVVLICGAIWCSLPFAVMEAFYPLDLDRRDDP